MVSILYNQKLPTIDLLGWTQTPRHGRIQAGRQAEAARQIGRQRQADRQAIIIIVIRIIIYYIIIITI